MVVKEDLIDKVDFRVPPLIGTHDGEFHADEVVAVSLLKYTFGSVKLIRTRDHDELKKADFCLDVGGILDIQKRRFDHHQKSYEGSKASAGMILNWLKDGGFIEKKFADELNKVFIEGVDLQDNGLFCPQRGICTFSDLIQYYNPVDKNSSPNEYLRSFKKAMNLTIQFIEKIRLHHIQKQKFEVAFQKIVQKIHEMPPKILILDDNMPWKEFIFDYKECKSILYVIFPVKKSKWILHTVPKSWENPYSDKVKLPFEWGGLLEGELVEMTGIKGSIFCHKQRFMAAFKSQEAALKASKIALKQAR